MPGYILHAGAMVTCIHKGQAQPQAPFPRVLVSGQPIVTTVTPYAILGCSFVPPAGNGPCATAQWVTGATRVLSNGVPVLLLDSQAVCTPTGTGLLVTAAQTRVTGM